MTTKQYTFRNNAGETVRLRGDPTVGDLARMGAVQIGLVRPETPIKRNEWRSVMTGKEETK